MIERYINESDIIKTLLDYEVTGSRKTSETLNNFLHGELPAVIHTLPGIYIDLKTGEIK